MLEPDLTEFSDNIILTIHRIIGTRAWNITGVANIPLGYKNDGSKNFIAAALTTLDNVQAYTNTNSVQKISVVSNVQSNLYVSINNSRVPVVSSNGANEPNFYGIYRVMEGIKQVMYSECNAGNFQEFEYTTRGFTIQSTDDCTIITPVFI